MDFSSVYMCYRPLAGLSYVMGQFSVRNVFVETSDELYFSYTSVSVMLFILEVVVSMYCLVCSMDSLYNTSAFLSYFIGTSCIFFLPWFGCLTCSQDIISALKVIDRMRETFNQLPPPLKMTVNNYAGLTTWLPLVAMIVGHYPWFSTNMVFDYLESIFYIFVTCSQLRQLLSLSVLHYYCSLVVKDTVHCWCRYSKVNCFPRHCLKDFCHLIISQSELINKHKQLLHLHVLLLLILRVLIIFFDIFNLDTPSNMLTSFQIFSLIQFGLFIGIMLMCVDQLSMQFKELSIEVLDVWASGMSRRDVQKVRVLLMQTHVNSEDFSAAGFLTVKPHLFISFLVLSVEYLITHVQNRDKLMEFVGVGHHLTSTNVSLDN